MTLLSYLAKLPNMKQQNPNIIKAKAGILKALAHPSRLAMTEALCNGTLCVCELQKLVGSDMSTVSKHLTILKNAGIVKDEKKGTSVYYTLTATCLIPFLSCIEEMIVIDAKERTKIAKECCKK